MTYEQKFELLREAYDIDETCSITINKSDDETIIYYDIADKEDNYLTIDFFTVERVFVSVLNGDLVEEGKF